MQAATRSKLVRTPSFSGEHFDCLLEEDIPCRNRPPLIREVQESWLTVATIKLAKFRVKLC